MRRWSRSSIHEFATAIGLPTEVGKTYVGEAVELRYRLPRVWRRVERGDLAAWRARRIARLTMCLTPEAAAFVDARIAPFAHRIRPSAVDRLIEEATARYMPDEAAARAEQAAEHRHFDIHTHGVGLDIRGTVDVIGTLDLADALDLDAAVTQIASSLQECGSDASLDVRRAQAVGELARRQLTFDFQPGDGQTDKQVLLHVHVKEGDPVAHLDSLPLMLEQVKTWCRDGKVTVKPVIDLNARLHTEAYEIPDRIREQVLLINPTCVFPPTAARSHAASTSTTSSPGHSDPPPPTTSHPCAGPTTEPRPSAPGPTASSRPAPTPGDRRTATRTGPTHPAPPTPDPTQADSSPAPDPPPHPAGRAIGASRRRMWRTHLAGTANCPP